MSIARTSDPIIWLDIETTDLDPSTGHILEIAVLATDADLAPLDEGLVTLAPLSFTRRPGYRSQTFSFTDYCRSELSAISENIRTVHTANGLIGDYLDALDMRAVPSSREVTDSITAYISRHSGETKPIMGGSSVTFDRMWLGVHYPAILEAFHHRSLDVSSVRELVNRTPLADTPAAVPTAGHHRALDDIHDSITLARALRDLIVQG